MMSWIPVLHLVALAVTCNAQEQPTGSGIHLPDVPPLVVPLPDPLSPPVSPQLADIYKIINANLPGLPTIQHVDTYPNTYPNANFPGLPTIQHVDPYPNTYPNANLPGLPTIQHVDPYPNTYPNPPIVNLTTSGIFPNFPDNFGFPTSTCPQQMTFPDVATFSGDPVGYPVDAIASELMVNTALLNCLTREIVLPSAPTIPVDPMLENATKSCKFLELKLWSFQRYGGKCWILQNFQEVVTYVTCLSKTCTNCGDFYTFGFYKNRCLHTYRFESVWAYCEALPVNQRIKRERLTMPRSCTCQRIKCSSYFRK